VHVTDIEQYLQGLVDKVCCDLTSMYPAGEQASTYGLVFPRKRDGSLRISEQEAKLLFVQHLTVDKRYCFSVETPTAETYQQKGITPMSARVDVTLIGNDFKPVAHVELKAHHCVIESIRKDLEKLLREKTTGCWFHTLEKADGRTLQSLLAKFKDAFSRLSDWLAANNCSYLFAFFVLDTACLTYRWLHFTGDKNENDAVLNTVLADTSLNSGWQTSCFRATPLNGSCNGIRQLNRTSGRGGREAYLILAPNLAPNSFLHLSVRGGSYRVRLYNLNQPNARPKAFLVPGYASYDALRASGLISRSVPVTTEDLAHNVDKEPQYWCERIVSMNSELATPTDSTAASSPLTALN